MARQRRRDRNCREVVVGERGMADMARKEDRLVALTRYQQLAVAEMARSQIGVNDDTVEPIRQGRQLAMGEAETPVFGVIGGAIGNPVGLIGQGMEMGAQLGERHCRVYWLAVLDDVEVVGREVHDARAILTRDVSVPDIPLTR